MGVADGFLRVTAMLGGMGGKTRGGEESRQWATNNTSTLLLCLPSSLSCQAVDVTQNFAYTVEVSLSELNYVYTQVARPRKWPQVSYAASSYKLNLKLNISLWHTYSTHTGPSTNLVHARCPDHESRRELVASGSEGRWHVVALEDILVLTLSHHKVIVLQCAWESVCRALIATHISMNCIWIALYERYYMHQTSNIAQDFST